MWRLIVVTFAFLGFAFYELSGGSDYQPSQGSRQHAAAERAAQPAALPQAEPLAVAKIAPAASPSANTRVILASASASDAVAKPRRTAPISAAEKRLHLTLNTGETSDTPANANPGVATVAADPEKIARLIAAAGAVRADTNTGTDTQTASAAADDRDLRRVKSTRVNMRQGPGKTFSVVAKLTRGTEVEVLRDEGGGWVKLRVLDSGRVGWMADFLLVAAK